MKTFLCIDVFPVTCWVEWVEATSAVEAEILFNISFVCHSMMFLQAPRRTCKYHVRVHVPEYQRQLDFQVWRLLLSLHIGQINVDQAICRCTSNCQPNHGALGFKQHWKSQPAESHSIRQLPQVSFTVQPCSPANRHLLSTKKLPLAPEYFVLPLGVPWLWIALFSAWKFARSPWSWCFLGKEECPGKGWHGCKDPVESFRASSHLCHSSFWGLNSLLLSLNPVSVHP